MVVKHEIGHLPFEADVTDALKYGEENRITVLCDNALLANTIPQGKIIELPRCVELTSRHVQANKSIDLIKTSQLFHLQI